MGITIGVLLIALVVEAAFATYCLITHSSQSQLRSWIRIGLLAVFILATLVSILSWSFRWYLLGALLLIWAALGVWTLIGKRPEKRAFSPWRSVFGAIGRLLLVVIVVTPALLIPQFTLPRPTGSHQVATALYTYTDPSRIETFTSTGEQRKINVGCWYPQDGDGKYPLVLFSHGAFGMKAGNISTFTNLASNGYVACSIDHPYHSLYTVDTDGRRTTVSPAYFQEAIDLENGKYNDDPTAWLALTKERMDLRINDMLLALNTLKEHAQSPGSDPVYQRIDPERIGLFGHSMGGATSTQIARERDDIDAVIDLDGSLFGEYLDYVDGKLVKNTAAFPVPFLIIYTDAVGSSIGPENDPDGTNPIDHLLAVSPSSYKVYLKGNHLNVTDLPLISPLATSLIITMAPHDGGATVDAYTTIEQMNRTVLEFFNVYLKGEGSFSAAQTQ